jgi:hypothetical protein
MIKRPMPGQMQSRPPDDGDESRFLDQVRRLPAVHRAGLWAWLYQWRRNPGRVFWVMDAAGRWNILS